MAFATLNFQSPALSKACSMTVILPERTVGTPPFPVFYRCSGLLSESTQPA